MVAEIGDRRAELEAICRRYGVHRLDVFGSAAGGVFRDDESDLDFLVEFESPGSTGYADRYFGLLEALEDLFGRPAELVVDSAIRNPYFRASVDTRMPFYVA